MSRSLVFNIETQTEDNEVISLCFVNENTIALDTSQVARTMFGLNRPLFDRINSSTKMIGGVLYREEIFKGKSNNTRLYSSIDNRFESNEKEISHLFFENNILKRQVRAITAQGRKVDYDPTMLKDGTVGGFLDPESLTTDDVSNMKKVCELEEISLFENIGIKTIMITDHLKERRSLLQVGYKLELNVETDFKEYIDLVMARLEKSLTFMTSYLTQIQTTSFYDAETFEFKKSFSDSIMNSLGMQSGITSINLSQPQVKNSEFGQAALNYYNGLLLLSPDIDTETYGKFLKTVLPTSRTSPALVAQTLASMGVTLARIRKAYVYGNKRSDRDRKFSKVGSVIHDHNKIEVFSTENLTLEKEVLGYSLFSSDQRGLNKFSIGDYQGRTSLEKAKYYPTVTPGDNTEFLTPTEKSAFARIDNAPAFLTPVAMMLGDKKVSTNRGMKNTDIGFVRQFRLAKSSRAQRVASESYPLSVTKARISNDIMSEFNIQIGKPQKALLSRPTEQQLDPLVDAEKYVGDSSTFATSNPTALIKSFKRILSRDDKRVLSIVSDIVPRRFLRQKKAIRTIKDLQFSNPKSKIRTLTTEKAINFTEIPPHIKFMMTPEFNPNPESDPLQNSESREIIEETQKNLFLIKALTGFGRDRKGFIDVRQPIYETMDQKVLSSGGPILAKAYDYEIPELGIVKDKFAATIYSNLIYIRG